MKTDFEIFDQAYANSPIGPHEERETFALKAVRAHILANDPEVVKIREALLQAKDALKSASHQFTAMREELHAEHKHAAYCSFVNRINPTELKVSSSLDLIDAALQNKTESE
jgi:hypothetical protein